MQNISLTKEYAVNDGICDGDRNRLKQVFWNVIRNAIEAMPHGGSLSISIAIQKDMIRTTIGDTGSGIDKKHLKELFVPFKSHKYAGVGLGLVIARKIIEKHHGTISFDSEYHKGTVCTVVIPKRHITV